MIRYLHTSIMVPVTYAFIRAAKAGVHSLHILLCCLPTKSRDRPEFRCLVSCWSLSLQVAFKEFKIILNVQELSFLISYIFLPELYIKIYYFCPVKYIGGYRLYIKNRKFGWQKSNFYTATKQLITVALKINKATHKIFLVLISTLYGMA